MLRRRILICATVLLLIATAGNVAALSDQEMLGKLLFFDTTLSSPHGQGCVSCHDPNTAFSDPDSNLAVSQGVLPQNRFGSRNAPSNQYAAFSPDFHFDEVQNEFVGGQFRDGRAKNLTIQALAPFLNNLEMNDPNKNVVIVKIRNSNFADLFKKVYGHDSLKLENVDTAYYQMGEAIAAFEKTKELNKFTSKFDYYLAGKVPLTAQEKKGLELFNDNCADCHTPVPGPFTDKPLFTDFTYHNIGLPSNLRMLGDTSALKAYYPFYYLPKEFNPDGLNFVDYGLGSALKNAGYTPDTYNPQLGKFKVPSLRNVAITAPYMHNGALTTLDEVVHFYNTRDVLGDCALKVDPQPSVNCWPQPEVSLNEVPVTDIGNMGLTDEEEKDIVAFLNTLTDGFS
jgi:cytochrome c peroxidase